MQPVEFLDGSESDDFQSVKDDEQSPASVRASSPRLLTSKLGHDVTTGDDDAAGLDRNEAFTCVDDQAEVSLTCPNTTRTTVLHIHCLFCCLQFVATDSGSAAESSTAMSPPRSQYGYVNSLARDTYQYSSTYAEGIFVFSMIVRILCRIVWILRGNNRTTCKLASFGNN
jgi:hypothetical protein